MKVNNNIESSSDLAKAQQGLLFVFLKHTPTLNRNAMMKKVVFFALVSLCATSLYAQPNGNFRNNPIMNADNRNDNSSETFRDADREHNKDLYSDKNKEKQYSNSGQGSSYDGDVYSTVDANPSFPGGTHSLLEYIDNNLEYPSSASDEGLEGVVWIQFIVEKDGSISNPTVVPGKSLSDDCDAEAIRIVRGMPKWNAGKLNGETVRCYHKLGIRFDQ